MKVPCRTLFACLLTGLFTLPAGSGLAPGSALAQQPTKGTPADGPEAPELVVLKLRNANATEVVRILNELFSGPQQKCRIIADERANSILVYGRPADTAVLTAIVARLEEAPRDNAMPTRSLRVFPLRTLEVDKAMEDAVRLVFQDKSTGNFALDRERKLLIASADVSTLAVLQKLLIELEGESLKRPEADLRVRIVWLATGLPDDAPPPPDDLKDVLASLTKVGIERPRLAGQTIVSARPDQQFRAQGIALLGVPTSLTVKGILGLDQKGTPLMSISVQGSRINAKEEVCNLDTVISAPHGHIVVLGVTPTGSMTSVFLIQVLPADTKTGVAPRR